MANNESKKADSKELKLPKKPVLSQQRHFRLSADDATSTFNTCLAD